MMRHCSFTTSRTALALALALHGTAHAQSHHDPAAPPAAHRHGHAAPPAPAATTPSHPTDHAAGVTAPAERIPSKPLATSGVTHPDGHATMEPGDHARARHSNHTTAGQHSADHTAIGYSNACALCATSRPAE